MSDLLEELEDSELTTATLFRRTVRQAQAIAKKRGRITRYVYDELVQREYDRLIKEGE